MVVREEDRGGEEKNKRGRKKEEKKEKMWKKFSSLHVHTRMITCNFNLQLYDY